MAVCSVFGCDTNNNKKSKQYKNKVNNVLVKLFRFPKDLELAKVWKNKCGRKDKINMQTAYICSKHFTRDKYIRNFQHEYSPKSCKKLKSDAIPTENLRFTSFSNKENIDQNNKRSDRLEKRQRRFEVDALLKSPDFEEDQSIMDAIVPEDDYHDHLEPITPVAAVALEKTISELQEKIILFEDEQMSRNSKTTDLITENYNLKQECSATSSIFTPTQKRKTWKKECTAKVENR